VFNDKQLAIGYIGGAICSSFVQEHVSLTLASHWKSGVTWLIMTNWSQLPKIPKPTLTGSSLVLGDGPKALLYLPSLFFFPLHYYFLRSTAMKLGLGCSTM
jgi:hypothetical protein